MLLLELLGLSVGLLCEHRIALLRKLQLLVLHLLLLHEADALLQSCAHTAEDVQKAHASTFLIFGWYFHPIVPSL